MKWIREFFRRLFYTPPINEVAGRLLPEPQDSGWQRAGDGTYYRLNHPSGVSIGVCDMDGYRSAKIYINGEYVDSKPRYATAIITALKNAALRDWDRDAGART